MIEHTVLNHVSIAIPVRNDIPFFNPYSYEMNWFSNQQRDYRMECTRFAPDTEIWFNDNQINYAITYTCSVSKLVLGDHKDNFYSIKRTIVVEFENEADLMAFSMRWL